ncbi:hypothetical protein KR018_000880 [Drosophila ironensis]|nr:hypothetical protein KR018_000880 [Drosophila ironensis]
MFPSDRWLLFWLMVVAIFRSEAGRILVVAPFESYSQCEMMTPYIRALADRGHQLTVIHAFQKCANMKNVTSIRITDKYNVFSDFGEFMLVSANKEKLREMKSMTKIMINAGLNVLANFEVQKLMKSNVTYDLVVIEPSFTDLLYGMAAHFQAPLMGISTCGADWNLNNLVGDSSSVMVEPLMPTDIRSSGSFWDRLYNWYFTSEEWLLIELVFLPKVRMVHNYFFGHLKQDFLEIRYSFSMILLNQHFSFIRARPSVPGMVEVAGFHIPRKPPKLPANLQLFIDEAENGVIYFSLGVELKCKDFPLQTQKILLETFKSLPQRVIWKFEGTPPGSLSENIYISDFLPQKAILAHSNVKLFIGHGGMLSIIEAVYYAKPMLGMPVFFDQFRNFECLVEENMALVVDINSLTKEELKESLDRLIYQSSFREKASEVSERFRDQPMHPLETAVYWTEYVLRHKGAKYMRLSKSHMQLVEYYSLDTFLLIGLRLFLIVVMVFFAFCKLRCCLAVLVTFGKRLLPNFPMIN